MAVVLVVQADSSGLDGLDAELRSAGHNVRKVATIAEAHDEPVHFIIVGPRVPHADRCAAIAHAAQHDCVLIALSSSSTGRDLPIPLAHRSLDKWARAQGRGSIAAAPPVLQLVAVDRVMRATLDAIDRAADRDSPLLITGETGSGKEILARRAHARSGRSAKRFVAVNCGSLSDTLADTQLFGYRKGAFTGALMTTAGMIDEAEGGVLFLDEVGEMPPAIQVRLLRFLDSGECRKVGDALPRFVDVRVIAATNRHLDKEVAEGRFRQDLLFRLGAITVEVPPLRTRPGDILALTDAHLRRVARQTQRNVERFADDAVGALLQYKWPGNVRQLLHVVEQAVLDASGPVVTIDDLPNSIRPGTASDVPAAGDDTRDVDQVSAVLSHYRGDRKRAAAALGISRTTLWRRLRPMEP